MRVLIVEDNPRISGFLEKGLSEEGYQVATARDGDSGFEKASAEEFDLAIVDVMLPGRSGIELVRDLRDAGVALPVLLLTARDQTEDKIRGLDAGRRRLPDQALRLHRADGAAAGASPAHDRHGSPVLRVGPIELDPARREVRRDGEEVTLTPKEYALLEYLLRNPNRPLSRAMIMEHVWGIRFDPGTNVVDVFINSLRNKVDPEREIIQTVRGVGYMLRIAEGAER
jgi:DNA-binding response OmpR family regulator